MRLKKLHLINFKNYAEYEVEFSSKINCFVGDNGTGKTNVLDAIHFLSFCKSYFTSIDSNNIRHGEDFFLIQGWYDKNNEIFELSCGLKRNHKKSFRKNKKEYEKLSEHIGLFPLVIIAPTDSDLVNGLSEVRRKFLDGIISQYNKFYLEQLISYQQALRQRNALLKHFSENKTFDSETLAVLDEQLCLYGNEIIKERKNFLEEFISIFRKYYFEVSANRETAQLHYRNTLDGRDFKSALMTSLARDRILNFTSVGPHKDDLDFSLNNFELKKFASQGQQKSYLLALKLAQYEFIKEKKNTRPLLLLDDVYDKLDEQRFSKLLELVSSDLFGQVFITDTHPERMNDILNTMQIEHKIFVMGEEKMKEMVE